jgi:hypothetical protein
LKNLKRNLNWNLSLWNDVEHSPVRMCHYLSSVVVAEAIELDVEAAVPEPASLEGEFVVTKLSDLSGVHQDYEVEIRCVSLLLRLLAVERVKYEHEGYWGGQQPGA